jgi:hypothetical protein
MLYKTCRYRDWTVHWFFGDNDFLYFTLDRLGADENDMEKIRSLVTLKNSGFTFSSRRESVVYVSPQTDKKEMYDTIIHEIRHLTNDICNYYDIDLNSEESAYIQGNMSNCVISILENNLCNE